MGEIRFSVKEIRTENRRIYYRTFADGVELPSLVYIFESEKNPDSDKELLNWCRNNLSKLETGTIVRADPFPQERKKGHRA